MAINDYPKTLAALKAYHDALQSIYYATKFVPRSTGELWHDVTDAFLLESGRDHSECLRMGADDIEEAVGYKRTGMDYPRTGTSHRS
jgi:hypothetical protein